VHALVAVQFPSLNMSSYRYLPLQGPSGIRILHIDPAINHTDSLSGKLVHVSLDDDPAYEALSYAWGSPELCSKITLDHGGAFLAITVNLDLALRRMRARMPPGMPTRIWADGICINQTDVPERNQQVRLMRRIYGQCQCGLIYLGEEADGSDEIPEFMRRLASGVSSEEGKIDHWHENPLLPGENDLGWQALRSLLERPWFLRVWIIQEFALPREIRMICGEWELSGDLIAQVATIPTLNHSRQAMAGLRYVEGSNFTKAWGHQELLLRCRYSLGHSLDYANFDALRGQAVGLIELLWACRQCKATDPRDHYFALLGLAPDVAHEPTLAADYSKSLEDVAIDYGRFFIKSGLGLEILYFSNSAGPPDETLPSWLPSLTHASIAGDKIWWLYEGKQHGVSVTVGGAELRSLFVSGCLLDTVTVLGSDKGPEGLHSTSYWRDDWIQEIDSLVAGIESYPSGQDVKEAVCRTIIVDRSLERQRPAPAYYYPMYLLCRKVGNRSFYATGLPWEVAKNLFERLEEAKHFDMAVAMLATSKFCVTRDGFFGMVPRNARPGDMIFTIQGDEQRAMFIVRKNTARDSYQWIGHAYVHDIWSVRKYEELAWEVITVD
jgi:Heterokaryon incompatibility protein (HET)